MEKRIPKSSTNPRLKQRSALVFSFSRVGDGTDGRKRPDQHLAEFGGLGSQVAGKER